MYLGDTKEEFMLEKYPNPYNFLEKKNPGK